MNVAEEELIRVSMESREIETKDSMNQMDSLSFDTTSRVGVSHREEWSFGKREKRGQRIERERGEGVSEEPRRERRGRFHGESFK